MARYTLSGTKSDPFALSAEFDKVEDSQKDLLSRKGESPNQMEASLDMNGNRVLNLPAPMSPTDPVRLKDISSGEEIGIFVQTATTLELIELTQAVSTGFLIATSGYAESGDGGGGIWRATGNTITPSQTPKEIGSATLSDASGNEYNLVHDGIIHSDQLGVINDLSVDNTAIIQAGLDSFSTAGGIVYINPSSKIKCTSLAIPTNVTLTSSYVYRDQDEGANFLYDSFFGGLFCTGLTLSHGSAITNMGIISSNLIDVERPLNDAEANAIVSNFSGTAISLNGTGTTIQNLLILGFNQAVKDNGNRHNIVNVRFDCINGIRVGGGSDVTRVSNCHAWPYITSEMGLSSSVNYRAGVAYHLENNADSYSFDHCYSFGYETGYKLLGQAGQIVQSPQLSFCRADSGNIGGSGVSKGFDIGNYTAQVLINSCQGQNYDILAGVNTQGADTGGGERLNNVSFLGGVWMQASDKFFQINNGYCTFTDLQIAKESTSSACFDWNTSDGGAITQCKFEELYETSGDGLIFDPANTTIRANVKRQFNKQASNIHPDNRMQETQSSVELFGNTVGSVPSGTGVVAIPHGLGRTPSWAMVQIRGDNAAACNLISTDGTNITVQLWDKNTGADITAGSFDILWQVKDYD